ncbi:MAG: EscU/YscU/HrcU family type III secretion system export apparatus switch protein [Myxococcales bacterium]|nr:EscU/YscU/HrcU family type III secretion system export apparatus switch protein [Myxococcales bacterium]
MSEQDDKPHAATPRRKQEYRDEGKFARSKDAGAVAAVGSVAAAIALGHEAMGEALESFFIACHGDLLAVTRGDGPLLLRRLPETLLTVVAVPLVAAALAGALVGAAQAGFRFYPKLMKLKFDRLNPFPQLKQMLDVKRAGWELIITAVKMAVIGAVCFNVLKTELPGLLGLGGARIGTAIAATARVIGTMIFKAVLALATLSAIDFFVNWQRLQKQMRMSTKDLKDEMKQYEQDGQLKGRMRARAREASRQRIIAAVGQADVIVTNPTHLAVAIRYAETDGAPIVVAKGADQLALRIRAEARKHGIPILENKPLARALYAEVDMGHAIGVAHYLAVAEVLAFVFRLHGGRRRTRRTTKKGPKRRAKRPVRT